MGLVRGRNDAMWLQRSPHGRSLAGEEPLFRFPPVLPDRAMDPTLGESPILRCSEQSKRRWLSTRATGTTPVHIYNGTLRDDDPRQMQVYNAKSPFQITLPAAGGWGSLRRRREPRQRSTVPAALTRPIESRDGDIGTSTVRVPSLLVGVADGPVLGLHGIQRPFLNEARSVFCLSARLSLAVTWAGRRGGCPRLRPPSDQDVV